MHQVAHNDLKWRNPDEMCYSEFMDTELLKQSWEKLTERGYVESPYSRSGEHHHSDGLLDSDSIETTPSYARYVR